MNNGENVWFMAFDREPFIHKLWNEIVKIKFSPTLLVFVLFTREFFVAHLSAIFLWAFEYKFKILALEHVTQQDKNQSCEKFPYESCNMIFKKDKFLLQVTFFWFSTQFIQETPFAKSQRRAHDKKSNSWTRQGKKLTPTNA